MRKFLFTILIKGIFILSLTAQPLQQVAPETVGISTTRLQAADEVIEKAIQNKEIPGAVLAVVKDGKLAYLKAFGNRAIYPSVEKMTTDTQFDIASMTKPIATATAAMILVEQGKIRLQDNVSLYIPQFKGWKKPDGKTVDIKIIDLMTHTSGLPSYADVDKLKRDYGAPNPDALLNYIADCRRDFEPRTNMQYSCLNYITLQRIIEKTAGMNLRDFSKKQIFEPLGMQNTDFKPTGDKNHIAPTQKQKDGSVLRGVVHDPLAQVMNGGISGNAGLFSTAEDLAIFVAALQNDGEWNDKRILSPLAIKTMRTIPDNIAAFGRSPGWDVSSAYASNKGDLLSNSSYGHTGYTGTSMIIDPENNLSIILLTNRVHPNDGGSVVRLRALVANTVAAAYLQKEEGETTTAPVRTWNYEDHYKERVKEFESEAASRSSRDIIMLGNSITQGGNWSDLFQRTDIHNHGISGDNTTGVLKRLDQCLTPNPKKIFLMIGINDIAENIPSDTIINNIWKITQTIRRKSPKTTIYIQSILPVNENYGTRNSLKDKTNEILMINAALQKQAKREKVQYINLYHSFTQKGSNQINSEYTYDGLHLNKVGYDVWVARIKQYVD